jgi:transposase
MAYSVDFRKRALQAVRDGYTKTEVNAMFRLSENTLRDWEKLEAQTGSLNNRPLNRKARKIDREKLLEFYKENPFSTNEETATTFKCSVSGLKYAKKQLKITRKKKQNFTVKEMKNNEKNLSKK